MTVPETLRRDLDERRRRGQEFPQAWTAAVRVVTMGLAQPDRGVWRTILEGHRLEWARAYAGQDLSPSAAAVATVAELWTPEHSDRGALAAR